MLHQSKIITQNKIKIMLNNNGYIICTRFSFLNLFLKSSSSSSMSCASYMKENVNSVGGKDLITQDKL